MKLLNWIFSTLAIIVVDVILCLMIIIPWLNAANTVQLLLAIAMIAVTLYLNGLFIVMFVKHVKKHLEAK